MKTILITGCSSGIGLATARALKKRGHRVWVTARQATDLEHLNQERFETVFLNLKDSQSIQQAIVTVLNATDQKLDVLIHNAAYAIPGAVEDLTRDQWREQFETNVFGAVELINAVIPAMRAQKQGRLILVSSIMGIVTMPFRGAYCASKYALESIGDALRMELKNSGITVSLIEPGPIRSAFRRSAQTQFESTLKDKPSPHRARYEAMYQRFVEGERIPFTGDPEDVAEVLVKAVETSSPRSRYYVTFPAYLFGFLRRILPTSLLDRLLNRV
ncbi:MAG TPA: SDR family NAD(P)-dependent oxidoreductase [Coxiellaceae bacterium]|nr:SDR family NAD(P)-dependent oxidoreductase [Coxiellaceae bacterium]